MMSQNWPVNLETMCEWCFTGKKTERHPLCEQHIFVFAGVLTFYPTRQIFLPGFTVHAHINIQWLLYIV